MTRTDYSAVGARRLLPTAARPGSGAGLTVVSTLYFGWHYIADDIAGASIAIVSVWLGGLATGQKFERHGRGSHPTTSTSSVPVLDEDDDDRDDDRAPAGTHHVGVPTAE